MAINHKKTTITLPIELETIIDALVEQSKGTSDPVTKSGFVATCIRYYLNQCYMILDNSKKIQKKEDK